ncbi:MAG: adenylate/guanylate cyclase domain-containing protein [Verrucomicrobiota bacterium]
MSALIKIFKEHWYGVLAPLVLLGLFALIAETKWVYRLENVASDYLLSIKKGQEKEANQELLLVSVDQYSMSQYGGWPWPRNVHGDLLYLLEDYKPSVLAFDVIFSDKRGPNISPEKDYSKEDNTLVDGLQEKMEQGKTVILAGYAQHQKDVQMLQDKMDLGRTRPIQTVSGDIFAIGGNDDVNKVLVPKPTLRTSAYIGFTDTAELEADNVRRFVPMVVRVEDVIYPSLITQILIRHWGLEEEDVELRLGEEIIFRKDDFIKKVPVNERGELRVDYQSKEIFEKISYRKLTEKLYAYHKANLDKIREAKAEAGLAQDEELDASTMASLDLQYIPEEELTLNDRIMLIGITEQGFVEFGGTPYEGSAWPVLTYLSAIDNIFNDNYLKTLGQNYALGGFLVLSVGTLVLLRRRRIYFTLGIPVLCVLGYVGIAMALLFYQNTLMMILWPVLGFSGLHVGAFILRWVEELRSKQELRSVFSSYIAPGVMEQLMKNPDNISLGGSSKPVTVLFSDIRGFTSISERLTEAELVDQLNEYFEKMVECVNQTQGTLHKYIGDAIMASWGDVISRSPVEDARNAVMSALAMREQLIQINQKWKEEGKPPFRIGIGLNHGEVLVGNIGAPQRREFTVIGDAVNLASRLESLTKQFQVEIAIGETVKEKLGDDFLCRPIGNLIVKGKSKPVLVYEVISLKLLANEEAFEWYDRYEEAFNGFIKGDFKKSYELFDKCLKERPRDFCTMEFTTQSRKYSQNPPDSWDGVIKLSEK